MNVDMPIFATNRLLLFFFVLCIYSTFLFVCVSLLFLSILSIRLILNSPLSVRLRLLPVI